MIRMRVEGGTETAAALAKLSTALSTRILRGALAEGAEPIRQSMGSGAPRSDEAPHVADNIVVSTARTEDQAAVAIGPARGFGYALPLEIGTVDTAAQPFARPAYDGNIERSQGIISAAIWRELAGRGIGRSIASPAAVSAPGGGDLL